MNELDREHERWSEELPAYLLGALPPVEADECERHLERCERCRAEARWLAPAVEQLPQSVAAVEPPPRLRKRVMAEVRKDADSGRASGPAARRGLGSRLGALSLPIRLRPLVGLAAVVVLLAAVGGYAIGNWGSGGEKTSTVVAGRPPGVTAVVVRSQGSATLRLAGVHALPNRRVLEAWVRRGGKVEPVRALFVPDREGRAQTTIDDMHGVEAVMVTAEPPGGSSSPTSAPLVTVAID
jgi:anti-sigma-K factor RskA